MKSLKGLINMKVYRPKYPAQLERLNMQEQQLPEKVQQLVGEFKKAVKSFQDADTETQKILLPILVQADAIIAADIYQLDPEKASLKFDKLKLLKLKAKAINLQTQNV